MESSYERTGYSSVAGYTKRFEAYTRATRALPEKAGGVSGDDQIRDKADQENILRFLRDKQLPTHPATIEEVMKNFASSACAYHVLRDRLKSHIGAVPIASSIAEALACEFSEERFRNDDYWRPSTIRELALDLAKRDGLTHAMLSGSREADPRILRVLHDGASVIERRSKNGLAQYYSDIESRLTSPKNAWEMLRDFTAKICHMGEGLSADFMKNIGFHVFVKPDFHFLRQLPELAGVDTSLKQRDAFILGWLLADKLGIHAFELDHTLYQWGRNRVKSGKASPTKRATGGASVPQKVAARPSSSEEILNRLMEYWRNEPTRKLTVERQRVLAGILSGYGGTWLPVSHFRPEHLKDMELRNKDAYPVVKALLCAVMERIDDRLQLKRGIVLGVRVLP